MSENDWVSSRVYRAFSHDVKAAILVFQNNKTAAMLVFILKMKQQQHDINFEEDSKKKKVAQVVRASD